MAVVPASDYWECAIQQRLLVTGDVLGHDSNGRIVLAVAVEPCPFDALANFGADLEDREREPDEEADGI